MKSFYNHQKIEKKWQSYWASHNLFQSRFNKHQPKFYVLDMFPYPSGSGLHVGHPKGYIATDVIARMKIMQGYNVLHPMGWDAFGLPAENYALEKKIYPGSAVEKNIQHFKEQLGKIGFTYDWSREVNTTDPQYYKWTQWIFLQLYKKGLAYLSEEPVNWCPHCKTVLANEDLEQGRCERCGTLVERRKMKQWVLKITDYAEKLLEGLNHLNWEKGILEQQRNWIGKSEGALIKFRVLGLEYFLKIFTTRLDTIFGCTYVVVAPENEIISRFASRILNFKEVQAYLEKSKHKSDMERTDLAKQKTGIELKGLQAINPFNNEKLPIFVSDYVLPYYGTGAIMGVPAHDERDFEFAKRYHLKIREVIKANNSSEPKSQLSGKVALNSKEESEKPFIEDGILIDSGNFSGLDSALARKKMLAFSQEKKYGSKAVFYKMHDWVFSRQRYWGEPFPIVYCHHCYEKAKNKEKLKLNRDYTIINGEKYKIVPVPEKDLPVELPKVKHYEPTGTGESPLANIKKWVWTKCPVCGSLARRETNTMPQWAGSCWYYLRYIDPKNNKRFVAKDKEKYWMPIDLYVGGAEHATRHLLYARFWHRFLYDLGAVSTKEPFKELRHVGLILAEDGRKMSKRWKNVINPDDVVKKYGADSLRLYEMFMGPFSQPVAWQMKGLIGMRRFLEKVWLIAQKPQTSQMKSEKLVHQTIKKVTEDIENFRFNTAISQLMVLTNQLAGRKSVCYQEFEVLLKLLSPFAPHIAEELWQIIGHKQSILKSPWPKYNLQLMKESRRVFVIQINGKVRGQIEAAKDISKENLQKLSLAIPKIQRWVNKRPIKKVVVVPGKLINFVV